MEHPIFRDDGDQLTMLTALLDAFPGQAGNPSVVVPIHPRAREAWAKTLIKRGIVVVPQLMEELPVATGAHPEAAWLQPMRWMKRADYEAQQADTAEASPGQREQARQMLAALDPDLEAKIAAMSDPEKRQAMADMATKIPEHLDRARQAQAQLDQALAQRARTDGGTQ